RAALPAAEQARLEKGGKVDDSYDTPQEMHDAVRAAGTPELRAALAGARGAAEGTPDFYAQHRARAEAADRAAEQILADLAKGKRKPRFTPVPSRVPSR